MAEENEKDGMGLLDAGVGAAAGILGTGGVSAIKGALDNREAEILEQNGTKLKSIKRKGKDIKVTSAVKKEYEAYYGTQDGEKKAQSGLKHKPGEISEKLYSDYKGDNVPEGVLSHDQRKLLSDHTGIEDAISDFKGTVKKLEDTIENNKSLADDTKKKLKEVATKLEGGVKAEEAVAKGRKSLMSAINAAEHYPSASFMERTLETMGKHAGKTAMLATGIALGGAYLTNMARNSGKGNGSYAEQINNERANPDQRQR